ncbi:MAG: hypothetical protein ACKOBZ_02600 [Nitrospira sp.]
MPLVIFVPKGQRTAAQQMALRSKMTLAAVYDYAFLNGAFQLS